MKKTSTILLAAMMLAATAQAQAAHIDLKVYDSYGAPLAGVATQLVTTQFTNVGSTDANGELKINVPNGTTYKLKLTYNSTTVQSAAYKTVTGGQAFDTFRTSNLTIQTKAGGNPVQGIGVQMLDATNSWKQLGATDAAGTKSLQVFAKDSMKVRAVASGSMEDRYVTPFAYGTNSGTACFCNLAYVNVPSTTMLVGSSWVGAGGVYLFPKKYLVKVHGYSDSLNVAGNLVNKVPCVIVVKDHNGAPLAGVPLRGGVGTNIAWHAAPTNANGVTIDWTNYSANPARIYEARVNVSMDSVVHTNAQVFNFKTSLLTLNLQDCHGNGIAGGHVRYGRNGISSHFPNGAGINTNAAGQTSAELFTGTYTLEMGINQGTETHVFTFNGTNTDTFKTVNVSTPWAGAVSYSNAPAANTAWFTKTGTQMLAGNYYFKFYGAAITTIPVTVAAGCDQVICPTAAKTTDITDVTGAAFSVYPNPAANSVTVTVAEAGTMRVMTIEGRVALMQQLSAGQHTVDVSMLPAGAYTIAVGNQMQKLIKQ